MAQIPSNSDVAKLQKQSERAEKKKLALQEKQGKGFENHGQGVIPEAVWKNLPGKKLDDPEATEVA